MENATWDFLLINADLNKVKTLTAPACWICLASLPGIAR